jgi:addiction module HigA family antidote
MLLEEFLVPMSLTQRELADAIHVPYQRINELVNGRRGVTPSTALRLARFLETSPGFWLNLQTRWDLYHAAQSEVEARVDQAARSGQVRHTVSAYTARNASIAALAVPPLPPVSSE